MSMCKYVLCAAAAAALTMAANADITMNIWDDGTDLYMSATGNYDMTNATVSTSFSGLGANAVVWATTPLFGWETNLGNLSVGYSAIYSAPLTASGNSALGASFVTNTNPFFFANFTNEIYFDANAPLTGSVNEFARFDGETLASLGMVVGETTTVSWGNGGVNERGTINTVVPAPGALALLGIAGLAGRRRRRA